MSELPVLVGFFFIDEMVVCCTRKQQGDKGDRKRG